jgi:hypothetical protein
MLVIFNRRGCVCFDQRLAGVRQSVELLKAVGVHELSVDNGGSSERCECSS